LIADPRLAFAMMTPEPMRLVSSQEMAFVSQAVNGPLEIAPLQPLGGPKDQIIRSTPRKKWMRLADRLQDLYYGEGNVDHSLRIDPETDAILHVDVQPTFMPAHVYRALRWFFKKTTIQVPAGGLAVGSGHEILPNILKLNRLFRRSQRFLSEDLHPYGHVSLASSYKGRDPFTILTYPMVKDWSEDPADKEQYLQPHALFSVKELKDYLLTMTIQRLGSEWEKVDPRQLPFQVLWTDHSVFHLKPVDLPKGQIPYASSFTGLKPFSVLTYDKVKEWTEADRARYLSTDARFTIGELKAYLKKLPYRAMVLLPDGFAAELTEEAKIHPELVKKAFEYVEVKGTEPTIDSYSAFFDNLRNPTQLAEQMKKRGVKRIFFTGLALDFCVGWSATGAANPINNFKSVVVEDTTRPVGLPPSGVQDTLLAFQQRGVRLVQNTDAILRANEGIPSLLMKLIVRRIRAHLAAWGWDRFADKKALPESVEAHTLDITTDSLVEANKAFNENRMERGWYEIPLDKAPHGGSYLVGAGLEDALNDLHTREFRPSDIEWLRRESNGRLSEPFLQYLSTFKATVGVRSFQEGRLVAPGEPIIRVYANPVELALIQDLIQNRRGGASIVATKWARIKQSAMGMLSSDAAIAKNPSILDLLRETNELGLRRAMGRAALRLVRAAFVGGAFRTSHVKAVKAFGLWGAGTMAHLFVMFFGPAGEELAFRWFTRAYPDASILLVDTYDTIEGTRKAIKVALDLESGTLAKDGKPHKLVGIRLDSGNLLELSIKCRELLDAAGLTYVKIFATNDLDEFEIKRLIEAGAKIDAFGVGTQGITGGKQAWLPTQWRKVEADDQIWRLHQTNGTWKDIRVPFGRVPAVAEGETAEPLLVDYWENGIRMRAHDDHFRDASVRCAADLKGLTREQRQLTDAAPLIVERSEGLAPTEVPAGRLVYPPAPEAQQHPIQERDDNESLNIDFYHLTMLEAMYQAGRHMERVGFNYTFRRPPHSEKPFMLTVGGRRFMEDLLRFRMGRREIEWLRSQGKVSEGVLQLLNGRGFQGDIQGMFDGELAFGNEPITKVMGTFADAAILETFLLLNRNYLQLIGTKAAIEVEKAGANMPVVEAGLPFAQGLAHLDASYASMMAGAGTTSIDAAVKFGAKLYWPDMPGKRMGGDLVTGGEATSVGGIYKMFMQGLQRTPRAKMAAKGKETWGGDQMVWKVYDREGRFVRRLTGFVGQELALAIGEKAVPVIHDIMKNGVMVTTLPTDEEAIERGKVSMREYAESPTHPTSTTQTPEHKHLSDTLRSQAALERLEPEDRGLKIAMAQVDVKIGDFDDVVQRIERRIFEAVEQGTDLLVFPETVLTGYPAQDAWSIRRFKQKQAKALQRVLKMTEGKDLTIILGAVEDGPDGKLYNVAYVIRNGKIIKTVYKHHLAETQVYGDHRRFTPGPNPAQAQNWIELKGRRIGIAICEDIWQDDPNIVQTLADQGATDVVVINGSHFYGGRLKLLSKSDPSFDPERDYEALGFRYRFEDDSKVAVREDLLKRRATASKVNLYYLNAAGSNDGIAFDGHSMVVDHAGRVQATGAGFTEDMVTVEVAKDGQITSLDDEAVRGRLPASPVEQDYQAAVLSLADYLRKNKQTKLVIGLSGGVDSSVMLAIAVDALALLGLPATNIIGISMPSYLSSEHSRTDARVLAANFGITFKTIPIGKMVNVSRRELLGGWIGLFKFWLRALKARIQRRTLTPDELYGGNYERMMENLQAGMRGQILHREANRWGALVLNNGNRAEVHRGYFTADADGRGSIAILASWPKTLVYAAGETRNRMVLAGLKRGLIPSSILAKAPSAELAAGQTDEKALGHLPILDKIDDILLASNWDAEEVIRRRTQCDPDGLLSDEEFARYLYDTFEGFHNSQWKIQQLPKAHVRDPNSAWMAWKIPVTMENPWANAYPEMLQLVRNARLLGYQGNAPRALSVRTENRGSLRFTVKKFPDGEFNVMNLDTWQTPGAEAVIRHSISSADDVVELLLMVENLRHYQAARVVLELEQWHPETQADRLLLQLLRTLTDEVRLQEAAGVFLPASVSPLPELEPKSGPMGVRQIITLDDRMAAMGQQAGEMLGGMNAGSISVQTLPGQGNHWSAAKSHNVVDGKNAVLVHATDSSENIVKLLLALLSLRDGGEGNLDLAVINTYEGYGRQDKVWIPGQTPAALAMARVISRLARHYAVSPHYADQIVNNRFEGQEIYKVNGFVPLARKMFDRFLEEAIGEDVSALSEIQRGARKEQILQALGGLTPDGEARLPVLLVAPDDGAYPAVHDAEKAMADYVWKTYGVRVRVMSAYLEKTRQDARTVQIKPKLLVAEGKQLELPQGISWGEIPAFVLDDETSTGGTLRSAVFALVRGIGMSWRRVYTGVVQAKLARGMAPFETGLTHDQRKVATEPEAARITTSEMPPYLFFASNSLVVHPDMPARQIVSLSTLVADTIENLVRDKPPVWRPLVEILGLPGTEASPAEAERPDRDLYRPIDPSRIDTAKDTIDVPWARPHFFMAEKFGWVDAEPAKEGEIVETRIGDDLVTVNYAKAGDWKTTTHLGDRYYLPEAKFRARYEDHPDADGHYHPRPGLVKALELTEPVRFMAPWGQMQYVPKGSVLIFRAPDDIYAVHRANFLNAYRRLEGPTAGPRFPGGFRIEPFTIGIGFALGMHLLPVYLKSMTPFTPYLAILGAVALVSAATAEFVVNWKWVSNQVDTSKAVARAVQFVSLSA